MNDDFITNIRKALKNFDSANKSEEFQNAKKRADFMPQFNAGRDALYRTLEGIGLGTAAAGWGGGPVSGVVGTALGGALTLPLLLNEARYGQGKVRDVKEANDAYQKALANEWLTYKNNSIKEASGGKYTVGSLARQGKMMNDDGDIVDIDYDYYKTVPYQTLERVFGEDGARYVQNTIFGDRGTTRSAPGSSVKEGIEYLR